jgi:hypothetical protein
VNQIVPSPRRRVLSLDHKRPDGADKILSSRPMLYKRDYFIRPRDRIVKARVVAIGAQK